MVDQTDAKIAYCPECDAEYDSSFNACPEDGAQLYYLRGDGPDGDPLVGATIEGRFQIEHLLGEGGMGKVYRARQLSVDRPVAIKVLHSQVGNHEEFTKRFLREARVVSGFKHPNIVRLVDFGQDDQLGVLYLAMELLDGGDLADLLSRGRFKLPLAVQVAVQVCAALSELHAAEVIHRDLKPENLMVQVTSDGSIQLKVLDFGIAKAAQGETRLTKTGAVFGTPQYMAPEQASGGEVSAGTDIYALGMILYQMIVGQPPFDGDTAMQIMLHHMNTPPPRITEVLGDDAAPEAVGELIDDMVAKAVEDRPASVLEVRDRLEAIEQRLAGRRVRVDVDRVGPDQFDPWILPAVDAPDEIPSAPPSDSTERLGMSASDQFDLSHTESRQPDQTGQPWAPRGNDAHSDAPAPTTAASAPGKSSAPVESHPRRRLAVVVAVLVVLIAASAAILWVWLPPLNYVGPGSAEEEYVWPWADHAVVDWPGGQDSDLVWPWDERAGFVGSNSDESDKPSHSQ